MTEVIDRPISLFDVSDPSIYANDTWREPFAALRRAMPISWCPKSPFGPYWSVVTHDLIREVEAKPHIFSSADEYGGITIIDLEPERSLPNFIAMDGPRHAAQRRTVQPAFNPSEMERREDEIRGRTRALIESLPLDTPFDWVEKVSTELTIGMLAILFDFPWEEKADLRRWSDWSSDLRPPELRDEAFLAESSFQLNQMLARIDRLMEEKRALPPTDDLISRMVHSEAMGHMPERERLGNYALLIVGGNDTTRNSMSAFADICARDPAKLDQLRTHPDLVANATQEVIRWQSPVSHMRRTALEDHEIGGQTIRKGEKVVLWYISGNRDEAVFADPETVDFARENARRHLGFGFGVHRCVGARLAELQLGILFAEVARRGARLEPAGKPQWAPTPFLHIYAQLPVRLVQA
ncbi:cytochrome P450 [Novosphingobium tardum]|jgi:cytochrome P450|uniref:Cytochrome P450 n=1 Tax=Novosphingobium tardum TaxID=1538021 RepID=A0ABV8RNE6_9SPHN